MGRPVTQRTHKKSIEDKRTRGQVVPKRKTTHPDRVARQLAAEFRDAHPDVVRSSDKRLSARNYRGWGGGKTRKN